MKKKLNATTTGLIVLIVSAALCLVLIQQLYRVDNKYTQTTPQAKEGVLTLTADAFSRDESRGFCCGWIWAA